MAGKTILSHRNKASRAQVSVARQKSNAAGIKNLKPVKAGTDAAQRLARMGGKAAQAKKNKIRTLREIAEAVSAAAPNESLMKKIRGFCPEMATPDATNAIAIVCAMAKRAALGDINASKHFASLLGQDPAMQVDVKSGGEKIQTAFALIPSVQDLERWIKN